MILKLPCSTLFPYTTLFRSKLMVMSGVVKLTSGDDCWWNLTALDYHYWSQPLPTIFGWWADQHPEWFKHFSVAFCLAVEIIDRKSTRLNSSHTVISYAVFCL